MAIIIPTNSSHPGDGPPAEYVIPYIAIGLLVWIVVAVAMARHEAADDHRGDGPPPPPDKDQLISGVMMGAAAAFAWPLTVVGGGVWLLVRHFTRPQTGPREEQP